MVDGDDDGNHHRGPTDGKSGLSIRRPFHHRTASTRAQPRRFGLLRNSISSFFLLPLLCIFVFFIFSPSFDRTRKNRMSSKKRKDAAIINSGGGGEGRKQTSGYQGQSRMRHAGTSAFCLFFFS